MTIVVATYKTKAIEYLHQGVVISACPLLIVSAEESPASSAEYLGLEVVLGLFALIVLNALHFLFLFGSNL